MTREEYFKMCEEIAKEVTHCKERVVTDYDLDYEFAALRLMSIFSDAANDSREKGYPATARELERCKNICRNSTAL
jgi:hypothetical protein